MKAWPDGTGDGNIAVISRASTGVPEAVPTPQDLNKGLVGVSSRFRRKTADKKLMIILVILVILLLIGLVVLAIYYAMAVQNIRETSICPTAECIRASATLTQSMDPNIDPCEDFYQFSCGGWSQEHPRPESSASYDWFNERSSRVLRRVREFLLSNRTKSEPKSVGQARDMYTSCMDTGTLDELSFTPLIKYLQSVNLPKYPNYLNITKAPVKSNYTFDFIKTITEVKKSIMADLIIGFDIFGDPRNRTVNRLYIGAPQMTNPLPSIAELDNRLKKIRVKSSAADTLDDPDEETLAYLDYVKEVMSVVVQFSSGINSSKEFEEQINLAAISIIKTGSTLYDLKVEATNITQNASDSVEDLLNLTPPELQAETDKCLDNPKISFKIWERYSSLLFEDVKIKIDNKNDKYLLEEADLKYLCLISKFLQKLPPLKLELWMWWTIVDAMVLHTTTEIRNMHYLYSKKITDVEIFVSRSIHCTARVNALMGMAVSYSIADNNFLTEIKPKVEMMLNYIRKAFARFVSSTSWMDKETKKVTLEKSSQMKSFIGFPEFILQQGELDAYYEGVTVDVNTHLENMIGILRWSMRLTLLKLRRPNGFGWATDPTDVNAFHTFQANAITVPLAILQYPFYHLGLEALNYGAIGSILGHELTHGFDDNGRQFDKEGNMRQWWTEETVNDFVNKTKCFIKQYSGYYLSDVDAYVDGELTLGENIADNGGLREAFAAYKLYVKKHGKESKLPGFEKYTHEQLFFLSFGNLWCETSTPESTRWALLDEHCPGSIRLRGVLSNSPEFSEAWQCKRGSKMNRGADRCLIW